MRDRALFSDPFGRKLPEKTLQKIKNRPRRKQPRPLILPLLRLTRLFRVRAFPK
jgi:hypothetical protein